jgi:hypothetical protein
LERRDPLGEVLGAEQHELPLAFTASPASAAGMSSASMTADVR